MKRNPLLRSILFAFICLLSAGAIARHHRVMAQGKEGSLRVQPPHRVTVPDVMPKEFVCVLDTSGSMSGSPLDKAKEIMLLAHDRLCPLDTFNVITFAGHTRFTQTPIYDLPVNGRAVQGFIFLTPGTVNPGPPAPVSSANINASVNGQRPTSNAFLIDGVEQSSGISPGGSSPGASASGSTPPLTATGASNPLASLNAVSEVTIRTYGTFAEFGRNSGGQVSIVTRSGTNMFHGSAFHSFSHEALDANDWFGNSRGLAKPDHRLNNFGGSFGGPLQKDHWFFFTSYEGLRLRQPLVGISDVPSLSARRSAPFNIEPLLNLYPLPNGPERPDGFAEFASALSNHGRHDALSVRIDGSPTQSLSLSGYLNLTNSSADERGAGGFSLNTLNRMQNRARAVTGKAIYVINPSTLAEFRANYSRFTSGSEYILDSFGGAVLPPSFTSSQPSQFTSSFSADLNARSTQLMRGSPVTSTQRQVNVLGSVVNVSGNHSLKFGADYRRMFPVIALRQSEHSALFDGVTQALTGIAARVNELTRSSDRRPVFNHFAAYGQDEWRVTPKLTLNYGLRWELSPAPGASDERDALAVEQFNDPVQLSIAPAGTDLWETRYENFAPRFSLAYDPTGSGNLVIRGSFGILYDASNSAVGDAYADSFPFLNGRTQFNVPFSFAATVTPLNPVTPVTVPLFAFDPQLQMPYTRQWSVSVERSLGSAQSISAAYVASAARRLPLTNTLIGANSTFAFLRLTNNGGASDYRSLQLQFNRRFSSKLGGVINYTWGKSADNASQDSAARALFRSIDAESERGPSDFDIRHTLNGFVSYRPDALFDSGIGNTFTRNWSIDSIFNVRSAPPINVVYGVPTTFGFLYLRPDLIGGTPLYVNDPLAAGGRRINPAVFAVPLDFRQGTLDRNALRSFALAQVNLALRRRFKFNDDVKLTVGAEATNVFNHPNFAAPAGNDASIGARFAPTGSLNVNPTFGQSYTNAARTAVGIPGSSFGSTYYPGGPRMVKLTVKFEF